MENRKLICAGVCGIVFVALACNTSPKNEIENYELPEHAEVSVTETQIVKQDLEEPDVDYTIIKSKRKIDEPEMYKNKASEQTPPDADELSEVTESEESRSVFYPIDDYNRYVIMCIVAGEAGAESYDGKKAVAQCIMNAMAKEGYTAEQVKYNYQYSGWNSQIEYTNPDVWAEIDSAVSDVFDNGDIVTNNPILYFYAPAICYSSWHESLSHDQTIGGHKFFYLENDKTANWFVNLYGEEN